MSINPIQASAVAEPVDERHATPHTAVLLPKLRKVTGLKTGLVSGVAASKKAELPSLTFEGFSFVDAERMRLGLQLPYYEVAFRGKMYRILARPALGQEGVRRDWQKFELIRTWAPGLCEDGWYLETPEAMPNTPRALVEELRRITNADLEDVVSNAHSIFHYRLANKAKYPETLAPAGYSFREVFLMSVNTKGNLVTHYDTPAGTNVELWTMFLNVLDRGEREKLVPYANSGMAIKEFRESGAQAMREALRLRDGVARAGAQLHGKRFLELFPFERSIEREVGRLARSW